MASSIFLDGPNGIGKTYAAAKAVQDGKFKRVIHHSVPKLFNRLSMLAQYKLKMIIFKTNTIFDRSWYSEYVYGQIYRHKSVLQLKDLISLNEFAHAHGILVKVYAPLSINDTYAAAVERAKTEEHPYMPSWDEYCNICSLYLLAAAITGKRVTKVEHVTDDM